MNVKKKAASHVPAGTETEQWRLMSADIAWALWSQNGRISQPGELDEKPENWEALAAGYRARVRATLRQLVQEGITFSKGSEGAENDRMPQSWWDNSARMAWLLWLRKRREDQSADENLEHLYWEAEAEDYRAYVRDALRALRTKGVNLDH